jgi:phosphoribosyl-ATP pyrophosphohydrolase
MRREVRAEQVDYEKRISAAYASGDNELAQKLTEELKEKVRNMEKRNRELVFVDLKDNPSATTMMMGSSMMGEAMVSTTKRPTNE